MNTQNPLSKSKWIASPVAGGPNASPPAPYLRKAFLVSKKIQSARLFVTALGLYECEINGRRVGDHVFAPGWTDYRKRLYYQVYDVSALVRRGENAIGAILGDGWYCGYVAHRDRQLYGDRPRFVARLEIQFADGSVSVIGTDETWKTATGPILFNDLLMGECYDARREMEGWSKAGFNDNAWGSVEMVSAPDILVEISQGPPVRRIEEIKPVSMRTVFMWPSEKRIFDFGQNFSGRVRLKVKAKRGTTLTIRHAEMMGSESDTAYAQTTLYTENLRKALAKDFYTCKGGTTETWEPRFTFHGFRHCEITGLQKGDSLEVVGIVLHSDTPRTGSFACSHDLLNQLQSNILWGQKSNFLEVPTDCPQRDERLGWTGDAQVFIRTACFNMDVQAFFHKWMQDMRDAQGEDGSVPGVCPNFNIADWGGPAWSDAIVICPWTIYLCYNDRKILEENYDGMSRYLDYVAAKNCKGLIQCHPDVGAHCYGDWLALDGSGRTDGATPKDLIGTAFYAYVTELMARIASLLGRKEDAAKYGALHSRIVDAFRQRFVTPEGLLVSGTQTSYILALKFNLLPEKVRPTAARELVREIERRGNHIGTGFVGTPYILEVLEDHGYLDVAYKLLEQETFPSWIFPIKNGATTIWERWDGWTPDKGFQDAGMNSFNHYAYGAVGAWMYRSVAGIELDPQRPGYRHIIFRPRPGGGITWAKASLETPHGGAAIHWKKNGKALEVNLTVPKGAKATFESPPGFGGGKKKLSSGVHRIVFHQKSQQA